MSKVVSILLALLLTPTALAASTATTIPVNATTQSACQFDTANNNPTIDLPDYEAALASTYVADQAQVSVSVYCNKGTPLSARKVGGSALATTRASAVSIPLTLDGVANNPTVNSLVWYTVGGSNTVPSGAFKGATRYVSVVRSGWPQAAQFSAPTGFYSGTVDFTVEF